jgi:hypothetical protein
MKWIIRVISMAFFGALTWFAAEHLIQLPRTPLPESYLFSALIVIGGNVIFAILDFFLTQVGKKLDSLASNTKLPSQTARNIRMRVRSARKNINLIALISLGLKGIGTLAGILMQQKALSLSHYPIAFAIGFGTMGAAIPALVILWNSLNELDQTEEELLRFLEDSNDRDALLNSIKMEKPDEPEADRTLADFGKVIR